MSMPYVNQRWLGGMLTNFTTVHKRLQRLKDLEAMEKTGEFAGRTKKEVLMLTREKDKLAKTLGGIRDMAQGPVAPCGSSTPRRSTSPSARPAS